MHVDETLREGVIAIAHEAAAAILAVYAGAFEVEHKADASPVTAADLAAHHRIVDGLRALTPDVPVLSEEAADIPLAERAAWTRWWLVDPLDGTKEFIAGSEEFTVNVALIEQGRVVFGVVGIPANGRCYYGGAGLGAWCSDVPGKEYSISVRLAPAQGFTLVASKRHSSAAQETLLVGLSARFGEPALANIGSSLKFCLLAEGNADCYPRLAPTSQWDTAAAQGVLEGAGGEVLNLAGEVLTYEARESFLNPSFLALPAAAEWRGELIELARTL